MEIEDGGRSLHSVACQCKYVNVRSAVGRRDLVDAGDDLVRIVTKLTDDLERFDALLLLHRRTLEQQSAGQADDGNLLARRSERLSQEAADMLASVREALRQLRQLPQAAKPRAGG